MNSALAATVLGVVIKLPFAMAFYILADNPQMKGREALKKSASLMKGHMMQYLVLQISFIPLMFLSILFLYVGLLWVMPYIYATYTIFYMDVTGELKETHKKHMHEVADWIPKELEDTAADKELQEQRTGDDYNSEA